MASGSRTAEAADASVDAASTPATPTTPLAAWPKRLAAALDALSGGATLDADTDADTEMAADAAAVADVISAFCAALQSSSPRRDDAASAAPAHPDDADAQAVAAAVAVLQRHSDRLPVAALQSLANAWLSRMLRQHPVAVPLTALLPLLLTRLTLDQHGHTADGEVEGLAWRRQFLASLHALDWSMPLTRQIHAETGDGLVLSDAEHSRFLTRFLDEACTWPPADRAPFLTAVLARCTTPERTETAAVWLRHHFDALDEAPDERRRPRDREPSRRLRHVRAHVLRDWSAVLRRQPTWVQQALKQQRRALAAADPPQDPEPESPPPSAGREDAAAEAIPSMRYTVFDAACLFAMMALPEHRGAAHRLARAVVERLCHMRSIQASAPWIGEWMGRVRPCQTFVDATDGLLTLLHAEPSHALLEPIQQWALALMAPSPRAASGAATATAAAAASAASSTASLPNAARAPITGCCIAAHRWRDGHLACGVARLAAGLTLRLYREFPAVRPALVDAAVAAWMQVPAADAAATSSGGGSSGSLRSIAGPDGSGGGGGTTAHLMWFFAHAMTTRTVAAPARIPWLPTFVVLAPVVTGLDLTGARDPGDGEAALSSSGRIAQQRLSPYLGLLTHLPYAKAVQLMALTVPVMGPAIVDGLLIQLRKALYATEPAEKRKAVDGCLLLLTQWHSMPTATWMELLQLIRRMLRGRLEIKLALYAAMHELLRSIVPLATRHGTAASPPPARRGGADPQPLLEQLLAHFMEPLEGLLEMEAETKTLMDLASSAQAMAAADGAAAATALRLRFDACYSGPADALTLTESPADLMQVILHLLACLDRDPRAPSAAAWTPHAVTMRRVVLHLAHASPSTYRIHDALTPSANPSAAAAAGGTPHGADAALLTAFLLLGCYQSAALALVDWSPSSDPVALLPLANQALDHLAALTALLRTKQPRPPPNGRHRLAFARHTVQLATAAAPMANSAPAVLRLEPPVPSRDALVRRLAAMAQRPHGAVDAAWAHPVLAAWLLDSTIRQLAQRAATDYAVADPHGLRPMVHVLSRALLDGWLAVDSGSGGRGPASTPASTAMAVTAQATYRPAVTLLGQCLLVAMAGGLPTLLPWLRRLDRGSQKRRTRHDDPDDADTADEDDVPEGHLSGQDDDDDEVDGDGGDEDMRDDLDGVPSRGRDPRRRLTRRALRQLDGGIEQLLRLARRGLARHAHQPASVLPLLHGLVALLPLRAGCPGTVRHHEALAVLAEMAPVDDAAVNALLGDVLWLVLNQLPSGAAHPFVALLADNLAALSGPVHARPAAADGAAGDNDAVLRSPPPPARRLACVTPATLSRWTVGLLEYLARQLDHATWLARYVVVSRPAASAASPSAAGLALAVAAPCRLESLCDHAAQWITPLCAMLASRLRSDAADAVYATLTTAFRFAEAVVLRQHQLWLRTATAVGPSFCALLKRLGLDLLAGVWQFLSYVQQRAALLASGGGGEDAAEDRDEDRDADDDDDGCRPRKKRGRSGGPKAKRAKAGDAAGPGEGYRVRRVKQSRQSAELIKAIEVFRGAVHTLGATGTIHVATYLRRSTSYDFKIHVRDLQPPSA